MMTKKSATVLVLCVCLALIPVRPAAVQWTQTSGPEGCEVTQIVGGGGKVFCLVEGHGIYFSADKGAHWSAVSLKSPANLPVSCLLWNDGTLFAGSDGFVAFSTDAGGRWHYIKIGALTETSRVISLARIGADLLVWTYSDDLYACPDYARKFSSFRIDLPKAADFRSVAMLGQELYACGLRGPVFRLQKTGQTWAGTEFVGPRVSEILCLLALGPDLFAGTSDGIFRSADRGESWTRITPRSSEKLYVDCLGNDGNDVLAGVSPIMVSNSPSGIRLSKGGGQEWTVRGLGLKRTDISGFASDGKNLYAGTSRGVWASSDRGATWQLANAGLPVASEVKGLAAIGPHIFASTSQGYPFYAGLSASADDGGTWQIVEPDLVTDSEIRCLAALGRDLFIGVSERTSMATGDKNQVLRSPDNGRTWLRATSGLLQDDWIFRLEVSGSSIYAATSGGVFETRDRGARWTRRGRGLPAHSVTSLLAAGEDLFAGLSISIFDASFTDPFFSILSLLAGSQRLFAAGPPPTGRLYVLRKDDSRWTDTRVRFSAAISCLAKVGTTLFAGTYRGLYVCAADLRSDQALKLDPSFDLSVRDLAVLGTDLIVGCESGVFLLRKAGGDWKLIHTGLQGGVHVLCLAMTDTFLYAGTREKGVWRMPLSELKKMRP